MTVFAKRDNGKGARASRMVQSGAIFALAATTYLVSPQIAQAQSYRFDQVAIEGNQRIEPRTILTYAGIGRGEAVTAGELNDAYQRLQGSGLFEKVELKPQGGKLVIAVQEFPTVNVVAFEGNDRIKDEILQGLIKTQSRKIYSPAAVEADAALITKGYSDIGRMAATVTPKVIRREGNRVDVAFEITEGKVTEIERLSFTGNRAYSDRRLRNVLNTKQAGFFRALVQRDTLVPERLEYDTQLLTDFYRSRGYVDVKVKGISSDYTRERDAFFVTFNIEEGQSFKFGDVSVISEVEGVDPAEYEKQIKIRSGVTYSPTVIDNNVARLEDLALKKGLNFIRVEPRITRTVSIAYSVHKPLSFAASCMRDLVRGLLLEMVSDGRWRGSLIERCGEGDQALLAQALEAAVHGGRGQALLRVHGLGHGDLVAAVPGGGHAVEQAFFDRVQRGLAALDGADQVEQAQVRHGRGMGRWFAWHARDLGTPPLTQHKSKRW